MDGQEKRTNQTWEEYLQCFISYQQDDCKDILCFAKFAYNNSIHSSTKLHHSMRIQAIILVGVYLKLPNYPQPKDSTIYKEDVSRALMTSFINPLYVYFLLF